MKKTIADLKREIDRVPTNERGRRKYGKELRARIVRATVAAQKDGQPLIKIAAALGVRDQLLGGWVRQSRTAAPVRPVEIIEDVPRARAERRLTLRLPCGAVVEGLSVADISILLVPGR